VTEPHPWDECSNCAYCSRPDGCCWCADPMPDPCTCTTADDLADVMAPAEPRDVPPMIDLDDPVVRAALLNTVSDLLYEPDDPRAEPWPFPAHLGQLRLWLRTLADQVQATA
jgi:hypothetical protein